MACLSSVIWNNSSAWWLLLCLAVGFLYAWFFYRRQKHLIRPVRYVLGGLRLLTVTTICVLLLSPLIKTVSRNQQKPLILVAQDNSSSISLFKPKGFDALKFVNQLGELRNSLGGDYEVHEFHFDKEIKDSLSAKFNGKQTDIASALKELEERYVNQNIGAIVLATDGIYNTGSSPQYVANGQNTRIYTIALGDTVPRRDLVIGNINYNKTAFLGNDFVVEVLVEAYQCMGADVRLNVFEDGNPVTNQTIRVTSSNFQQVVPLKLNADKKGVHKFTFSLQEIPNEVSVANNTETGYIEVLDNKHKVLLLYNSPHPDVSAIKTSLERNNNFEVTASLMNDVDAAKIGTYSLVILHQLPAAGSVIAPSLQAQLDKLNMPRWYIVGAQSDIVQFNRLQKFVQVSTTRQDMQEVFASVKTDFSVFTLSDSTQQVLGLLPPLLAPYGNFESQSAPAVLLTQKIGQVKTAYPLLAFGEEGGSRIAVLCGEGIWKWRLAEFSIKESTGAVDELLSQSVQYLTAKSDRSRFKVYPARNEFDESETVLLSGELYNEALELINTPDVKVELKGKSGKTYSYILSRNGNRYQLNAGILPPDEYAYHAETKFGGQTFTAAGQFAVKSMETETRQSTADHHLLNTLSKGTGGQMLFPAQIGLLARLIKENEDIKTVVYSDEIYRSLIDEKWGFYLLLILLTAEWFLRKREGEI